LHRHFPAAEFDQFGAKLLVSAVERGAFHLRWQNLIVGSHGGQADRRINARTAGEDRGCIEDEPQEVDKQEGCPIRAPHSGSNFLRLVPRAGHSRGPTHCTLEFGNQTLK
jgi:hypothetical protein